MQAPLGYYTVKDYVDNTLECGGAYYTRSFAMGMCISHTNTSAMYTYDGIQVSKTMFSTVTCDGIANVTNIALDDCTFTSSASTKSTGYYQSSSYNAGLPPAAPGGVQS